MSKTKGKIVMASTPANPNLHKVWVDEVDNYNHQFDALRYLIGNWDNTCISTTYRDTDDSDQDALCDEYNTSKNK